MQGLNRGRGAAWPPDPRVETGAYRCMIAAARRPNGQTGEHR
jgi:hypothetical protein